MVVEKAFPSYTAALNLHLWSLRWHESPSALHLKQFLRVIVRGQRKTSQLLPSREKYRKRLAPLQIPRFSKQREHVSLRVSSCARLRFKHCSFLRYTTSDGAVAGCTLVLSRVGLVARGVFVYASLLPVWPQAEVKVGTVFSLQYPSADVCAARD